LHTQRKTLTCRCRCSGCNRHFGVGWCPRPSS
jgi:hypothetical protein